MLTQEQLDDLENFIITNLPSPADCSGVLDITMLWFEKGNYKGDEYLAVIDWLRESAHCDCEVFYNLIQPSNAPWEHPVDTRVWPGRYTILVLGKSEYGTAYCRLWRFMEDREIARLFALCELPSPEDRYEASQAEDTFSQSEAEAVRQFFSCQPDITEIIVEPAEWPKPRTMGMSPAGDMYCGWLEFEDLGGLLPGQRIIGTIVKHVAPDGRELQWDESLGGACIENGVVTYISDKERSVRAFEENDDGDSDLPDAFKDAFDE